MLLLAVRSARAQDSDAPAAAAPPVTLRAVVRVAGGDDADVLERLRGHVSDLAVELVVVKGELEARERARRAAASRLARRESVRAVVWFTPLRKGGFRVHVADVERKQLLERDVAPDKGKLDRSALLETAALVVRSAFFAMQEGTDIGPPEQFKEDEEPPAPTPPRSPAPRPREPLAVPAMALGGEWAFDATGKRGYPGLLARASLLRGDFGVELGVHLPLVETLQGEFADVSLWRVPIWLGLDVSVWRPAAWLELHVAARGAIIIYERTTDAVSGGAMATPPATTAAGGVGPEIRLQFRIVPRLRVELSAGADVVANAPDLHYQRGDESLQFAKLWLVQPHAGLNLLFH